MDRFADMEFAPPPREERLIRWMPSSGWVVEHDDDDWPMMDESGELVSAEWVVTRWVGGPDPIEVFGYYSTKAEAEAVARHLNETLPPRPAMIHESLAY